MAFCYVYLQHAALRLLTVAIAAIIDISLITPPLRRLLDAFLRADAYVTIYTELTPFRLLRATRLRRCRYMIMADVTILYRALRVTLMPFRYFHDVSPPAG